MIQFKTLNSVYEVDHDEHRIRRVEGASTGYLATGPWRTFLAISRIREGAPVFILWCFNPDKRADEYTITSAVTHVMALN